MFQTSTLVAALSWPGYVLAGIVSATYSGPLFLFIASAASPWSSSLILVPGVAARSVTAAVGNPPTQKNASIFLSFIALTLSAAPRRS